MSKGVVFGSVYSSRIFFPFALQTSGLSSGKAASSSKGGKGPGSKAKDPIQERKDAQLADEAQVCTCLFIVFTPLSKWCAYIAICLWLYKHAIAAATAI